MTAKKTAGTKPAPAAEKDKPTVQEILDNLNGYDEIAVQQHFDHQWDWLSENWPSMFGRALAFLHLTHGGMKTAEAKRTVMELTLDEVNAFFADDTEVNEDEPVTEAGKGA